MKRKAIVSLLTACMLLLSACGGSGASEPPKPASAPVTAPAAPQAAQTGGQSSAAQGGSALDPKSFNGHTYQFFDIDLTWTEARDYCIGLGGHLVTVTSAEEENFLKNQYLKVSGGDAGPWLGAYSDGAFGGNRYDWRWVTDEEWSYENWDAGEPSNSHGTEWYAHFWKEMLWNDVAEDDPKNSQYGFICEFDELSDALVNDGYASDLDLLYFNGHTYEYIDLDLSWIEARDYCRARDGHLVTITSPEEQNFLEDNFYGLQLWIGAFESDMGWRWVTDEEWYYENWTTGEPSGGEEWCGCFWNEMLWNDLREADPGERVSGFICEYDDWTDWDTY
ncbi:MAG: hypothetical protein E7474_05205 [Ruminococcaceae bacterium]|nr:hypothetical protein [Oscillospiraceae bacterium]